MSTYARFFSIKNIKIQVDILPQLVGGHNNNSFDDLMKQYPRSGIQQLAQTILTDYHQVYGEQLKVSSRSLEIEIWGHYYLEKILIATKRIFVKLRMVAVKKRLLQATKVFDCGESPIDKNRWIWDVMSWTYPVIKFFIRDKPNSI